LQDVGLPVKYASILIKNVSAVNRNIHSTADASFIIAPLKRELNAVFNAWSTPANSWLAYQKPIVRFIQKLIPTQKHKIQ
jgi:hypothetical protein